MHIIEHSISSEIPINLKSKKILVHKLIYIEYIVFYLVKLDL